MTLAECKECVARLIEAKGKPIVRCERCVARIARQAKHIKPRIAAIVRSEWLHATRDEWQLEHLRNKQSKREYDSGNYRDECS
jgi:hypothetical protein